MTEQQPQLPEPTGFDLRAMALQKAVETHGFAPSGQTVSQQQVLDAAEVYLGFLQGSDVPEATSSPGVLQPTDTVPEDTEWAVGDLVLERWDSSESVYVYRREEGGWRVYAPGANSTWTGTDQNMNQRLNQSWSNAHHIIAIKNGQRA